MTRGWTEFTPAKRKKLLDLIRKGNYRDPSCKAVGVGKRTLYNWLSRGATGEEPYATFARELDEAEVEAEAAALACIVDAGPTDWRAAAWFVARKHPERWAERPAPPPETKTAEVAAAELAELLTQAGWKVTPPEGKGDE